MENFHRKILSESMDNEKPCPPKKDCSDDSQSQTPPLLLQPPPSVNHALSPYLIFLFCGLAVSFSLICYLTLSRRYRQRETANDVSNETNEDFVYEDHGPEVIHHPIWLINTIGLDPSEIESIHVFKYKKDQGLIEGTDCSICLSEFEDDESLRLLPKCSHAFHVPCIDTWLRSHKNCPMCRAPIIKTTSPQTETTTIDSNSIETSTTEEHGPGEDSETVDHHVVEVEKTLQGSDETRNRARVHSDLVDRHRVQGQELLAMRRSISMDESSASNVHFAAAKVRDLDQETHSSDHLVLEAKKANRIPKQGHKLRGSSSSIHVCSKLMKTSSFGHSLRKASSFKHKCPLNRSY